MLAPQDEEFAQTPRTEGSGTIEDKLPIPVQIKKNMRQHNKPKKAHDYVVSPEGMEQILLCPAFATLLFYSL